LLFLEFDENKLIITNVFITTEELVSPAVDEQVIRLQKLSSVRNDQASEQ
jgi:hypothetical protein